LLHSSLNRNPIIVEFVAPQILGHILVGQQLLGLDAHQTVRRTAILNAAQKNNGVAQVIPGYLVHFPALGTLHWQNERQAKHIVLTQNEIHPELHEVDTRTTKITGDICIQLKPQTAAIARRELASIQAEEKLSRTRSRSAVTSPPMTTKSNRGG
jgi:hypothetical protein